MLIVNVLACDLIARIVRSRSQVVWLNTLARYFLPLPVTILISWFLSGWTGIPPRHCLALALLIPLLVIMGHHTGTYVEADLGIQEDESSPGRGGILDTLKSLLFTAPVVFHYIHYFLK